jgi:ABC-type sugar transport system permease subunit
MSEEIKVTTKSPSENDLVQRNDKDIIQTEIVSGDNKKTHRKRVRMSLTHRRMIVGYVFILPWLIGFFMFYVRSVILAGRFSMSLMDMDANAGGYTLKFIGLENYIKAFREHATFKQVLTTSLTNMLVDVPLITFFSLFMAILLNKKFKGRAVFRAIFFLPIILNSGAISEMMALAQAMMNGGITPTASELSSSAGSGVLAFDIDYLISMFMNLGLPARFVNYLSSAVSRINEIISASGVQIIIFIAALQSIPGSMYEVAKIEGATGYETFWKVTFPMVMPHIITNVVYTIVDSFTDSAVVDLAHDTMFKTFNWGLGSAFTIISTIVTCAILGIVVFLLQKRTFYYN